MVLKWDALAPSRLLGYHLVSHANQHEIHEASDDGRIADTDFDDVAVEIRLGSVENPPRSRCSKPLTMPNDGKFFSER